MRRYSPQYYSPPRRGYGGRPRSPPRRGYGGGGGGGGGGGYGRRKDNQGSLLVRNIPLDCGQEELKAPFQRFGALRDVYIPKDFYTGEPRGFAFVQFVDSYDALEAQRRMNGQIFAGREISVVVAAESRKRPEDMRHRTRTRGGGRGERSSYYGRSRSRSLSRSPRYHGSRSRYRSRSYSPPAPRHRRDYSASPVRRHPNPPVRSPSPRGPAPPERDMGRDRLSYSPQGYGNPDNLDNKRNGYAEKHDHGLEEERAWRRPPSPGRTPAVAISRSPPGSRSRSPDLSPGRRNGR